jgi:hypothetical protein
MKNQILFLKSKSLTLFKQNKATKSAFLITLTRRKINEYGYYN